jgi:DNA-directed RNA polymerase specialized sigma24 family protein
MSSDPHSIDTQKRNWDLSSEAFEALLRWLNADREEAGKRYEEIRRKLIRIFACRGCLESDLLADETINRVARKVEELAKTYEGDPALYFYGVANKIHLEQLKKAKQPTTQWQATDADEFEAEFSCLDHCMSKLPTDSRDLVLKYYDHGKNAKIEQRRMLAATLNIGLNALRIRAHRIHRTLHRCIHGCLDGPLVN